MTEALPHPVVVENRAGAGGNVGSAYAAQQPPDGHTLVIGTLPTQVFNTVLYGNPGCDPARDLVPITMSVAVPLLLAVPATLGVRGLDEFLDRLRREPGRHSRYSAGNGTASLLAAVLPLRQAGVEGATHVPYRGTGPAVNDLVAGRVSFAVASVSILGPLAQEGRLTGLALAHPRRLALLPEVPTMAEAGLPGYDVSTWNGWFGPRGTPGAVLEFLARAVNAVHEAPETAARLEELGTPVTRGFAPATAARFVERERERWVPVVRASGARID